MLWKYIGSFLSVFVLVCLILSMLPFATRSQVRAGTTMDETFTFEFTLDASGTEMYPIDKVLKAELEGDIAIAGEGIVQVHSTKLEVTPKDVSWTVGKTRYTASGGRLVANVVWEASAKSTDGRNGDIRVDFPQLSRIPNYTVQLHNGGFQKTPDGRWLLREVTAYPTDTGVTIGRLTFALSTGLPITIVLQSIWWLFQIKGEKRARVAALNSSNSTSLPRVFHSSPTIEWSGWTVTLLIFGAIGSLMAGFVIYDGYKSSSLDWFFHIIFGIGVVVASLVAWHFHKAVVTVRIDADRISYATGRGEPQWITARWSELKNAMVKIQTTKKSRTEWMEIIFPDGKIRKIPSDVMDYPTLRDTVSEFYARCHQT